MFSQQHSNMNFYVSEYPSSLESLVNVVAPEKLSIVVQVLFTVRVLMYVSLSLFLYENIKLAGLLCSNCSQVC
jgi:hypothetical protein